MRHSSNYPLILLLMGFGICNPTVALAAGFGEACGGFGEIGCDPGLYCEYGPLGSGDDATGVCAAPPAPGAFCPPTILPVCGRNGRTYRNDCIRQLMGDDKVSDGPCPPY